MVFLNKKEMAFLYKVLFLIFVLTVLSFCDIIKIHKSKMTIL